MLQMYSQASKKAPSKSSQFIKPLKYCLGVTLIELMVSISISSIFSSIAILNANEFAAKTRVNTEISRLTRLLYKARYYAINSQSNVVICALENINTCTGKWDTELSVFIDTNGNNKFDPNENERLVATKSPIKNNDVLMYSANKLNIIYLPTGHLYGSGNGTFKYCPKGYEDKSRGIEVARSGRFYSTADNNQDGIDETRSNIAITCS